MNNELQLSFKEQHDKIVQAAAKVGLYLYEFCKALKDMKDSKLYISAGYESFEDYCIQALNIKKSQAYSYCKLCETYSPQFFQSTGKIGITKLELLTALPEEEAEAFIKQNNVENITVRELKKTIATYKDKKDQNQDNQLDIIEIEIVEPDKSYTSFGDFLKDKRLERGYSLRQFSRLVNRSHSYIKAIESGVFIPPNTVFYRNVKKVLELSDLDNSKIDLLVAEHFKTKDKLSPITAGYILDDQRLAKIVNESIINGLSNEKLDKILSIIRGAK